MIYIDIFKGNNSIYTNIVCNEKKYILREYTIERIISFMIENIEDFKDKKVYIDKGSLNDIFYGLAKKKGLNCFKIPIQYEC